MTTKPARPAEHMPQLDGLRALAFGAVAISHWMPSVIKGVIPWGTGVQLFFVLSGFLITGILLRSRPQELGLSMGSVLRVFYARRFLRIFPLYYGVIVLALLLDAGTIRQLWPWHVGYLSNFHYAWSGFGSPLVDPFSHLWSLSVEEQFYLLWPLLALIMTRGSLTVLMYASLVAAVVFRISVDNLVPGVASVRYLTLSCIDGFAVGGLVAQARHYDGEAGLRKIARNFGWVGGIGLVVSLVPLVLDIVRDDARHVGHTFLVIFYGFVVAQAARGFGGLPGRILEWSPVQYLGRISYGLYVYHFTAAAVVASVAGWWGGAPATWPLAAKLAAYSAYTLGAASLSWHLYESPINNLKRWFAYPRPAGASGSS